MTEPLTRAGLRCERIEMVGRTETTEEDWTINTSELQWRGVYGMLFTMHDT
jgi:hypothetical protein